MESTTRAAIAFDKSGPLEHHDVELSPLKPDEVLVEVKACSICHTDIKFRQRLQLPAVFGHEGVGTVVELGSAVTDFETGQRVVMSYPFCNQCRHCASERYWQCEDIFKLKFSGGRRDGSHTMSLNGSPLTAGFFQQSSFATRAICLADALVPVDTTMPDELLAALPCGIQTGAGAVLNTFGANAGDSLLVVGAGTVGLSAVLAARHIGVSPIICADINADRLRLARKLGATHTVDCSDQGLVSTIKDVISSGVSLALDASATVMGLKSCISALAPGGQVGIVSFPDEGREFLFSTRELFQKIASIKSIIQGSSVPREFIPRLIDLYQQGEFDYVDLITTYDFEDINQAMADMKSGKAIKPVLRMGKS